jgi:hypothetical protein
MFLVKLKFQTQRYEKLASRSKFTQFPKRPSKSFLTTTFLLLPSFAHVGYMSSLHLMALMMS